MNDLCSKCFCEVSAQERRFSVAGEMGREETRGGEGKVRKTESSPVHAY